MPTKPNSSESEAIRKIEAEPLQRSVSIEKRSIDEESRTVEVAFSSETPVARWFGDEILDHSSNSVRLDRIRDGGPLLVDHNPSDHIGTIEEVRLDGDRVGRARVRFGKSARAEEIFQDVLDGIRSKISFMYKVYQATVEERGEDGEAVSYRVTDWEPYEISFVSMPADNSVGVGRSADPEGKADLIIEEDPPTDQPVKREVVTMPEEVKTEDQVDIDAVRQQAAQDQNKRMSEVLAAGDEYEKHGGVKIAREVLRDGGDLEMFNKRMLESMGKSDPTRAESPDLGMTDKEVKRFSLVRAINAMANPDNSRFRKAAEYEFEVSSAAAEKLGKESRGLIIPADVLRANLNGEMSQRDLVVGTTTAGGHTVATDLLAGSFIDLLRNRAVMMQLATILGDLNGNIAIPRQTGGATAYWVAESGDTTESQQAFDQVTLSPKTVGAHTEISRKLLLQSSLDVEAFVRRDLATTLALAIDLAAINGSGSSNQPTGILNQSGIGDVAGGANGLAPTWNHIVDLETEVAIDNADIGSMAYLTNAKVRGKLKKTFVDSGSNAERVWDTRSPTAPLNGYQSLVTNQVPSTLDKGSSTGVCSAIIFGNFADLIIGMWGGLDVVVNPYSKDVQGTVRITALQDIDIAVRHPQSFAAMQDALTA